MKVRIQLQRRVRVWLIHRQLRHGVVVLGVLLRLGLFQTSVLVKPGKIVPCLIFGDAVFSQVLLRGGKNFARIVANILLAHVFPRLVDRLDDAGNLVARLRGFRVLRHAFIGIRLGPFQCGLCGLKLLRGVFRCADVRKRRVLRLQLGEIHVSLCFVELCLRHVLLGCLQSQLAQPGSRCGNRFVRYAQAAFSLSGRLRLLALGNRGLVRQVCVKVRFESAEHLADKAGVRQRFNLPFFRSCGLFCLRFIWHLRFVHS